jgi:16S rRNA G1207 methylase RsmC
VNKAASHISTLLQDRDALAVAFAEMNACSNGCASVSADCGLAFEHLEGRAFDLIFSNLPAKAGRPVLDSFFRRIPSHLTASGIAAVVVIETIADFARRTVDTLGFFVTHTEKTRDYSVIHFRPSPERAAAVDPSDTLASYVRTEKLFTAHGTSYALETVYNLPDFDTLGHPVELAFDVLSGFKTSGRLLFWNPGQGHIPVFLSRRYGRSISEIYLSSRDALEIAISERNTAKTGIKTAGSGAVAGEAGLSEICAEGSMDFLCAVPHPIPGVAWQNELTDAASSLLKSGGSLFVVAKSTEVHRLLSKAKGFSVSLSRKHLGYRAVLLTKTSKPILQSPT